MPTNWVVTTPTDRVELDAALSGLTTFTVTNPSTKVDRVVFDVVASDGADTAWFSVDEPQRRVQPSGSVSYLVKTAIPATAAPGTYSIQGRAYSADSAPEEDSVLSGRLAVTVAPKAAPTAKRRLPWWVFAVAGLIVVVLVVVIGLVVFRGGTEDVAVPDVSRQSQQQATTNLAVAGLTVGTVWHKLDPAPDQVIYQSAPGGSRIARGSAVDLIVTVALKAPTLVAPADNATVPASALTAPVTPVPSTPPTPVPAAPTATPSASAAPVPAGLLQWSSPDPFVHRWQVLLRNRQPFTYPNVTSAVVVFYPVGTGAQVDRPSFTPLLPAGQKPSSELVPNLIPLGATIALQWQVAAVDDFGNVGPASAWFTITVK